MVYDASNWGGTYYDAEKTPPGDSDDEMCWAAAASNVLAWTGWGDVASVDGADLHTINETDAIFKYFQTHWTDEGGWPIDAWAWWFSGINPDSERGAARGHQAGRRLRHSA